MRKIMGTAVLTLVWAVLCSPGAFSDDGLVAWWKFDQEKSKAAADSVGGIADDMSGNFGYAEGARGKALRFDGYTTFITRPVDKVPRLVEAFTIEAWIAPQTYSWNWTAIVDQAGDVVREEPKAEDLKFEPGLVGAKYNEPDFRNPSGTDTLVGLDNNWTGGLNDWSARWRGHLEAPATGEVTFTAEADNGLRLEIDNRLVIDGWGPDKPRSGKISLEEGKRYPVVLSYYQDGDPSILKLYWSWEGQAKTIVAALSHTEKDVEYVKTKELSREGPPPQREPRVFFGIDHEGHIGVKLMVDGKVEQCVSDKTIPLLKWSHIAATFSKDKGIDIYVDGEPAGSLAVKGVVTPEKGHDLLIGMSHQKMSPANTERSPSRKLLSNMIFDGLIDEVKIHSRALSADQIAAAWASVKPPSKQPLAWRIMPSGPKDLKPRFGAAYGRLRYSKQWEDMWRVGPDPDILVLFDESPVRLLFWRGTAYGAVWVAENGRWMGDQSLEATGNSTGWGCSEHMSDKQCRYSYVRLIENHDARVVVHWRYAISDIVYGISRVNDDGWGEWADEYYYIYPDAVSTRWQILHSNLLKHEWQETIVLHQPGTRPEDNIDLDALTWANMEGETHTYSWRTPPKRGPQKPSNPTIQVAHLKAKNKPFIIYEPQCGLKLMTGAIEKQWSHFTWWNHWPAAQLPDDGRRTGVPDRPAHTSLSQSIEDSPAIKHDKQKGTYSAVTLYGMSEETAAELVPLARSWNHAAELKLISEGFINEGYDKFQRAYVLGCKKGSAAGPLEFELAASEDSPVVNPAFVIKGWGDREAALKVNGKTIERGRNFRLGHYYCLEGSDLVVWMRKESTKSLKVSLVPQVP